MVDYMNILQAQMQQPLILAKNASIPTSKRVWSRTKVNLFKESDQLLSTLLNKNELDVRGETIFTLACLAHISGISDHQVNSSGI